MKKILGIVVMSFFLSTSVFSAVKCIKGNCKNGYGILSGSDGRKYEGNFENGKFHGKGIHTWPSGKIIKYEGNYKNGKIDGKGTLEFYSIKNDINLKNNIQKFLKESKLSFLEVKVSNSKIKNLPRPKNLINIKNQFMK